MDDEDRLLNIDRVVNGNYKRKLYKRVNWVAKRPTNTYWSLHIEYHKSYLNQLYKLTNKDYEYLNKLSGGRKEIKNTLVFNFNKIEIDYTPEYYKQNDKVIKEHGNTKYRAFNYVNTIAQLLIDNIINIIMTKKLLV